MSGKSFFVDLTKCTACRGCQVACKQWHGLPAEHTVQIGTHQNPQDLSYNTYKLVRFEEHGELDTLKWLFFPEQCRHCVDPPCMAAAEVEGAIIQDPQTGAVIFTEKTAQEKDPQWIIDSCPYNIPRKKEGSNELAKCDMCNDRVKNGLLPACVQSCPTGAMNFGDREDMIKLAQTVLKKARKRWPEAHLVDLDDVRVIYLAAYEDSEYFENLSADATGTGTMTRRSMFAKLGSPLKKVVQG